MVDMTNFLNTPVKIFFEVRHHRSGSKELRSELDGLVEVDESPDLEIRTLSAVGTRRAAARSTKACTSPATDGSDI
jgi:hypothetical protein